MLIRYLLRVAAGRTAAWTVALTAIYLGVDLADRGSAGNWPLDAWTLRWPTALVQVLPVASLAGATHCLVMLERSREWLAARAAGVSVRRLFAMLLVVPAFVALTVATLQETALPLVAARWHLVGRDALPGAAEEPTPPRWIVRGQHLLRTGADPLRVHLSGAPRIEQAAGLGPAPAWPAPSTLATLQLLRTSRRVTAAGHDGAPYRAEAAFRPVLALAAWLLPWIALPLVLRSLRRGALAAGAWAGAVALGGYLCLVLGVHAARAGNAVFGAAGAVVTLLAAGLAARVGRTR